MDTINICSDCYYMLANGGGSIAGRKAVFAIHDEGYRVEPDLSEPFFGKMACDLCGTHLAGARYEATLVPSA